MNVTRYQVSCRFLALRLFQLQTGFTYCSPGRVFGAEQTGIRKFWFCGQGTNILYSKFDLVGQEIDIIMLSGFSKARHRLDGVVYAVKITKKRPKRNSRDEKVLGSRFKLCMCAALHLLSGIQVALNEVFVLAAMMKHRHVVR